MSEWPSGLTVGPIREWPGVLRSPVERVRSPFASTLSTTLALLTREVYHLVDTAAQQASGELLVAIDPSRFTRDGRPYAAAKAAHPGVVFSLDTRHGHLSYPCDRFPTWQDNLRAIALALEALRKVDRYGVTAHGQQYRGFLALEAPAAGDSVDDAVAALALLSGLRVVEVEASPAAAVRKAQRVAHPDHGGTRDQWDALTVATNTIRAAGLL